MRFLSIILATLAAHAIAFAQPPVYTLEQCREMALETNADLRTADNNLRAAIATRREAFTKYFPQVQAAATLFRANHDMLQYDVLDLFTLGIIDRGHGAAIWALQPVFAGGQIVNGNRLARVGEEAEKLRRQKSADDVALQTEALYWQLASLKATRQTLYAAVSTLDTLAEQVAVAVDAGVVTRNDLLKVELKRNGYRADIVDADNGIGLLRMLLAQQIGLGPDSSAVDIDAQVPDIVPVQPDSLYTPPADALPSTADYRLLLKNVEAKSIERRMELGSHLPTIAVGGGWVWHNVLRQNHNFGVLALTVSVPISDWWGGSYAIKRKSIALDNARLELDNLSQKLQIEMSDKWDNLTAAHRKMRLAAESIAQSEENLRLNRECYEAGVSTVTDLLDAQALHQQALDDYIASYGVMRLALTQYLTATGRGSGNLSQKN